MKMRVLFSLFVLFAASSCRENSPSEVVGYKTTMKVPAVYNAGKIVRGEVIHAKFEVENTGEHPLVLSDVSGSCSCTVADWSKDPIAPGEKGYVKADVKTESFNEGPITRSVTIVSNSNPVSTKVSIEATIIK
ncbi:MAG TPA: DUF1573 domain-containing protein [Fluviicola sp.]|nr:DUF1573 domain-containing protein [Fluviicola sp.]